MQQIPVIAAGKLAQAMLADGAGSVYAVFRNSLYLKGHTQLSCVVTHALPRGPLNIVAGFSVIDSIQPGESWCVKNNLLLLGNRYQFALNDLPLWQPQAPANNIINPVPLEHLNSIVADYKSTKGAPNTSTALLIDKRLHQAQPILNNWISNPSPTTPEQIKNLIGCGDGLTPAGDDLLLGAVVTLQHFNHQPAASLLTDFIKHLPPGRTNDISLAHLLAACDGQANEFLHQLLSQVSHKLPDLDKLENCVQTLLNIGHSSGLYTLYGALTAMQAIQQANTHSAKIAEKP